MPLGTNYAGQGAAATVLPLFLFGGKSTKAVCLVLLSLVLVVAGLVWLSLGECAGSFQRTYHTIVLGDKDFIPREVRFKVQIAGTLLLPNGRLGGFTTVRASDCVEVTIEEDDEGSPSQAVDEMEKRIRGGVRIIERVPIRDQDGELVGELVALVKEGPKAEIISLKKGARKLFVIESKSLAHALAYEKLIQNGYRLDPHGYVIGEGK